MHVAAGASRIKLAVSSSMMNEFWLQEGYAWDSAHIDWITSHVELCMWELEYREEVMAQDILVITGLNNVRCESLDVIMGRIGSFTAAAIENLPPKQSINNKFCHTPVMLVSVQWPSDF